MTFLVRQAMAKMFKSTPDDLDMHIVYDVSHNIAKVRHAAALFSCSGCGAWPAPWLPKRMLDSPTYIAGLFLNATGACRLPGPIILFVQPCMLACCL